MCSWMSGFTIRMLGRFPVFSRNWSTMASFTLYATNLECLNSVLNTTLSTAKVVSFVRYWVQSILFTASYTSSAVFALK